jgi:hypothetical protein
LDCHCYHSGETNSSPKSAFAGKQGEYEMVLTNPPFGKKSSVTIVNELGDEEKQSLVVHRDDFWASTSNKQLTFLQHVFTILKQHGRAAIVVPDNVDSFIPAQSSFAQCSALSMSHCFPRAPFSSKGATNLPLEISADLKC